MLTVELAESTEQCSVFTLGSDGDAQTTFTKPYVGAVSDDDALIDEVVVNGLCVVDAGEEEVGIGGEDLQTERQFPECGHEAATFKEHEPHPLINLEAAVEDVNGFSLGGEVDVIRVFHLVEDGDDVSRRKGHADA